MKIQIRNNQSLLDIAIQCRGTAEAAFEIALANNISVTDDLSTGQILFVPDTQSYNKMIAEYYQGKGILPATAITDDFMNNLAAAAEGGIGKMIINVSFMAKHSKKN